MRLLPAGSDHAGRFLAQAAAKANGSADRRRHGGQHLPLRNLSAHTPSHQVSGGVGVMANIQNMSRRGVIKGAAIASGLVLGFHLGFRRFPLAEAARAWPFQPNVYVAIDETGLVSIVAHRSEMGTGIKTDLPLIVADELEADWKRVKVVQAEGDARYGDQNTDGSRSTWQFYQAMREAGATARQMLEAAAGKMWGVPPDECRAENGAVVHSVSERQLSFGDLVKV